MLIKTCFPSQILGLHIGKNVSQTDLTVRDFYIAILFYVLILLDTVIHNLLVNNSTII